MKNFLSLFLIGLICINPIAALAENPAVSAWIENELKSQWGEFYTQKTPSEKLEFLKARAKLLGVFSLREIAGALLYNE